MNQLPPQFLILTHEGIFRAVVSLEQVYNIDTLLARFVTEKLTVLRDVAEHPYGLQHLAIWGARNRMAVLELTKGAMTLATDYREVKDAVTDESWVSPCFRHEAGSFQLRCAFDFGVWASAGLRLFLGLNSQARTLQLWLYYDGQIYRPPLGNIFDATCQICLGRNESFHKDIFRTRQPDSAALSNAVGLLSNSTWNADTFHSGDLPAIAQTIRFDSSKQELPMLAPRALEMLKQCSVAANKDLAAVTQSLIS